MQAAGLETVARFSDVIDRAGIYVCDNSSTLYEWAALDRPVVILDAPWYRRDVSHGLRFWQWADIGPRIQDPADLVEAVRHASDDVWRDRRAEATEAIFGGPPDGHAAGRATEAILSVVSQG